MKRIFLTLALAFVASCATPGQDGGKTASQGWSDGDRGEFYTRDQGSRIMKTNWMKALKQPDGQPFLADKLDRYGYLPNDLAPGALLPIGFTTNGSGANEAIGMTCSACHTREITIKGVRHRIDGGPAIVDFEALLVDLDIAVKSVLSQPAVFEVFARDVLGTGATTQATAALKQEVVTWDKRFGQLVKSSILDPRAKTGQPVWGPGRLDAVSMIFNRLTGLDIAPDGRDGMIPENIYPAHAPVRYPFLWGSAKQDLTQWPGFAPNGDRILGLVRNVGEVYGVFADFHPTPKATATMKVDYASINSVNIPGLRALERQIEALQQPAYPWPINADLANQGKDLFGTGPGEKKGLCWDCHGERQGKRRLGNLDTWETPLRDVGTDNLQYSVLMRTVKSGTMNGSGLFPLLPAIKPVDDAANVLKTAVVGGILQKLIPFTAGPRIAGAEPSADPLDGMRIQAPSDRSTREHILANSKLAQELTRIDPPQADTDDGPFKYESRVLRGIWAAAPYLHNGSVPTLADLLEPASNRPESFKVGPEYDPVKVGLAADQTKFSTVTRTTTCEGRKPNPSFLLPYTSTP